VPPQRCPLDTWNALTVVLRRLQALQASTSGDPDQERLVEEMAATKVRLHRVANVIDTLESAEHEPITVAGDHRAAATRFSGSSALVTTDQTAPWRPSARSVVQG
jgi:hypothetical protein